MRIQIEPIPVWRWDKHRPKPSPFSANYTDTLALLDRELRMLGAGGTVALQLVCSDEDIRRDGLLRASARLSYDGVAISFESKFGALTYPCDTYRGWQSNLRAIALSLEALRAADRHGVARRGEQYAGWRAIESGTSPGFSSPEEALRWLRELTEWPASEPVVVGQLLRRGAAITHPDRGGDRSLWDRYDAARQLLVGSSLVQGEEQK
jgi:hypothetical protein